MIAHNQTPSDPSGVRGITALVYQREKIAWHEAGHVAMALLLDAPVLHAVVTGHTHSSVTRVVTDGLTMEEKVSLYMGGAVGQYLLEKPKGSVLKALARILRSTTDANHDYLAAFRVITADTGNIMESRRILELGILRTHILLSDSRNAAGIAAIAHKLLEACPNPLRGLDVKQAFDNGRERSTP